MATIKLRNVNPVVFNYKVGIGESNPNEALVVAGTSRIEGTPVSSGGTNFVSPHLSLKSLGNSSNWAGFSWKDKNDNFLWSLTNDLDNQNGTNELSLRAAHGTAADGAGFRIFTALADGKTGWGVTDPESHVHIGGTAGGEIRLSNSTIGDTATHGSIIKADIDKHFFINNKETGSIISLQIGGAQGIRLNSDLNLVLGGGSSSDGSRVTIEQASLGNDVTKRMLLLYGKYSLTALDKEGVSIGAKLEDSNAASVTKDLIRFKVGSGTWPDSNIDTLINNEGGSVSIGTGTSAIDGLLNIRCNVSDEAVRVRIKSMNADAYLSFGDNASNFYAGIDTTYGSFNIAHGSGVPGSSDGGIVIWPITSNVGIGTGSVEPHSMLSVFGDSIRVNNSGDNASGRLFLSEGHYGTGHNDYGFSLLYAGAANPTLDGVDFTLAANHFYIMRHNNSAIGNVAVSIDRETGLVSIASSASGESLKVLGESTFGNIDGRGIRLTYSAGNDSGIIDSITDHNLEFRIDNIEKFSIRSGKLLAGAGTARKSLIRLFRDDTESSTDLYVCQAVDHSKDVIIYSKELLDIREDDVLVVSANWGIAGSDTISYNPHVHYGLILADEPTSAFTTTEGSNYIRMMSDKVTHIFDSAMGETSYGARLTGAAYSDGGNVYNNYSDIQVAKAFDGDEDTYAGYEGLPSYVQIDLGAGVTKTARKIRIKPTLNNAPHDSYGEWGGVKAYTFHGSNDLTGSWTQLTSGQADNSEDWHEREFANTVPYRYYKLIMTNSYYGAYPAIAELEIFEVVAATGGVIFPQEQVATAMYKVTADDVTASRNCVNFIVWAKHGDAAASCADKLTLASNGQLDVLHVHGAISD